MKRASISDTWVREFHTSDSSGFQNGIKLTPLTFCGTLEEYYGAIARNWNNETRVKYDRDYNNVILPHIENHNSKIISSYTQEDCDRALARIKDDGYESKEGRKEYSEGQLNHFKYLIYSVFKQAALVGVCQDFLWGTKYEINEDRESLAIHSKTQIKKSLTVRQEKNLFANLTESPDEDGRRIALLLMFALGLRDGEACGLDYGDIYELPYYKGCYVAIVRQTTIPNSSMLQSSGKTWNSGRRIPIPSKVVDFLLERKKRVSEIIDSLALNIDIDKLPVACKGWLEEDGSNLSIRLKADNVTEAAKTIFRQVDIESEVLASLEVEMEEESARLEVTEKSVTAYLLRRNFATHLKILGLDYPDIQYLLGHCIDDPYINRPDYTDSKLYHLSQLMQTRPLVNKQPTDCVTVLSNTEINLFGKKTIEIKGSQNHVKVQIAARERMDELIIGNLNADPSETEIALYEKYKPLSSRRSVNVLKKYVADYK